MNTVLIAGGTGLIGKELKETLLVNNYKVHILTRNPKKENEFKWDLSTNYIDKKAFNNVDILINLTGENIAGKRWSSKRKEEIINSRVQSTELLLEHIKKENILLKRFISSSAVGIYGAKTVSTTFAETSKLGNDYLSEVCKKWETAALKFKKENIPTSIIRTGIVLTSKKGALEKMNTPIIFALGTGKQYMPWIHIKDLCNMFLFIIKNNLDGIYNGVAPEHQTNKSFSKILAIEYKKPLSPINLPSLLIHLIFGEMSQLLLQGSKISSKKITTKGFNFDFKNLSKALNNLKNSS